jgi:serine/threonine protein kinase
MRYIDLFRDNRSIGRFTVPDHVKSQTQFFRLSGAARTGGNGVVFDAHHMQGFQKAGMPFAVKMLRQLTTARVDRFHNEARVMKDLDSQFIAKFFDSGSVTVQDEKNPKNEETVPWIAMQLGGPNMRSHVEQQGRLDLHTLKKVTPSVCQAIAHLHSKGFIHRDIKPENFVWQSTKHDALLMIDFGIAKRVGEDVSARPMDTFTQVKEFVGPVFFSSPELIEYATNKAHPVDGRSDVFQAGKLLWFLGTGKISAGVPSRKECPAGGKLREVVLQMIDDDPNSRIQTMQEVELAITAI